MQFTLKGVEYQIVYVIEDLYEHHYNITLQNDAGEEFDIEDEALDLSTCQALEIYMMVDEDAWSSAIDSAEYAYGDR